MHCANHAIELLVGCATEYAPRKMDDGVAHLQDLGLFIGVRERQAMKAGPGFLFVSEITASARERQPGITITCVGFGPDMASAVANACAQWATGVLPVLARWRGKHSCCSGSQQIDTQEGRFELLAGPEVMRGRSEDELQPIIGGPSLSESFRDLLGNHRPAPRLHWLELYAAKFDDGSVDATCRLDNRNWTAGRKVLLAVASAWPTTNKPLQSSRQFVILLPQKGDPQAIVVPTFFAWLLGKG